MPKVSIVLPTFNGSKYIKQSVESVLSQTFTDFELIIVNDCSTDDTLSICNELKELDSRITIISNETNKKLPASLNIGFRRAVGEYFTWTSDDNLFKKDALEKMVNYLDLHKDVDMVSCNFDRISSDGKYINSTNKEYRYRKAYELAFYDNIGACFLYKKEVAEKAGLYDEIFFCAEDYEYWCRIAINGSVKYLDDNLYLYRIHDESLSSTKKDIITKKSKMVSDKYILPILTKFITDKKVICQEFMERYICLGDFQYLKKSFSISPVSTFLQLLSSFNKKKDADFLVNEYKKIYSNFCDNEIIIWGTGAYGKKLFSVLREIGFTNIKAFCNSSSKEDDLLFGLPVLSPVKALNLFPKSIYLIASDYGQEILEQFSSNQEIISRIHIKSEDEINFEKSLLNYFDNKTKDKLYLFFTDYSLLKWRRLYPSR